MKTKKLTKKLTLNKTTIADLGDVEMNSVKGGTRNPTIFMTGAPICCITGPVTCWSVRVCKH